MNPQSAAIAGSGNPLKSRLKSDIWAKICSNSTDPFAYSLYITPYNLNGFQVIQLFRAEGNLSRRNIHFCLDTEKNVPLVCLLHALG